MWPILPSLGPLVQALAPAFTQPSFHTGCQLLVAWVMCLGRHTLQRVGGSAHPEAVPDHSRRHGLDPYYNFFERSAWTPTGLAYHIALLVLTRLLPCGPITLLVDDTLAHKRGRSVWGLAVTVDDGCRQETQPAEHREPSPGLCKRVGLAFVLNPPVGLHRVGMSVDLNYKPKWYRESQWIPGLFSGGHQSLPSDRIRVLVWGDGVM